MASPIIQPSENSKGYRGIDPQSPEAKTQIGHCYKKLSEECSKESALEALARIPLATVATKDIKVTRLTGIYEKLNEKMKVSSISVPLLHCIDIESQVFEKHGVKISYGLAINLENIATNALVSFKLNPTGKYLKVETHHDVSLVFLDKQIHVNKKHADAFLQAFHDNPEHFGITNPSDYSINILEEEQWVDFQKLLEAFNANNHPLERMDPQEQKEEQKVSAPDYKPREKVTHIIAEEAASPIYITKQQSKARNADFIAHVDSSKTVVEASQEKAEQTRIIQKDVRSYREMQEKVREDQSKQSIMAGEISRENLDPIEKASESDPKAPPKTKPIIVTKKKQKPL